MDESAHGILYFLDLFLHKDGRILQLPYAKVMLSPQAQVITKPKFDSPTSIDLVENDIIPDNAKMMWFSQNLS